MMMAVRVMKIIMVIIEKGDDDGDKGDDDNGDNL